MNGIYRQGDVLIMAVDGLPDGLISVERDGAGRVVLAEGEVTGHAHCIAEDSASLFSQADQDEMADRFLRVESEVRVVHEEHSAIVLPPADYVVRRQREYVPSALPRMVAD